MDLTASAQLASVAPGADSAARELSNVQAAAPSPRSSAATKDSPAALTSARCGLVAQPDSTSAAANPSGAEARNRDIIVLVTDSL
jgi:hypothetical protein